MGARQMLGAATILLLGASAMAMAQAQTLDVQAQHQPDPAPPPKLNFSITPLGEECTAINASGQVAVRIGTQAWLFTPAHANGTHGALAPLGTLGGTISIAQGINAAGQLTGYSTLADGTYRAFLADHGPLVSLGDLGGAYSSATDISESGLVTGFSYGASKDQHGFVWTPQAPGAQTGAMLDLGTLGGDYSDAEAVNAAGVVVGYAYTPAGAFHAFRWQAGAMTDLGTLGGSYSKAEAIDEAGRSVGQAYLPGNSKAHACLWDGGAPHDLGAPLDLGTLGGSYSEALGIDPAGNWIVGQATVPGGALLQYHAVLFLGGAALDLNALLPPHSGWLLQAAEDVNAAGQVVGTGTFAGQPRGFLLSPVP